LKVEDLEQYRNEALSALNGVTDTKSAEEWYRVHLARSGRVASLKKQIGQAAQEERPAFGTMINNVAAQLEAAFKARQEEVKTARLAEQMMSEAIDVTLPPRPRRVGGYHPVTLMLREVYSVFASMGFTVFDSPHVELDEYNFQLLNIPPYHPARDMQDTFFVSPEVVLRTHTSPGQIRAMRLYAPGPVQVILPGLCYRHEDVTPRSEMQFHQVEGLLVGPHVRMSDLKGILHQFARVVFGDDQEIRLRGSYFPFTEPSVEVDIKCTICAGAGCRVCKHSGWLELLGSGLVHPVVLQNGGYDPTKVRGIAFGIGIERMILLRHGINDIRYFYQNDLRFLRQFV
jgi:phenylalanyl-tRNA synthetase alpha chain